MFCLFSVPSMSKLFRKFLNFNFLHVEQIPNETGKINKNFPKICEKLLERLNFFLSQHRWEIMRALITLLSPLSRSAKQIPIFDAFLNFC